MCVFVAFKLKTFYYLATYLIFLYVTQNCNPLLLKLFDLKTFQSKILCTIIVINISLKNK